MDGSLRLIDGFAAYPERFLWHGDTRTAILADLHLGGEANLARAGIYMPDVAAHAIKGAWARMAALAPARVVVAGDLFDSPEVGEGARRLWSKLAASLPAGCELLVTPGNHDPSEETLRTLVGEGARIEPAAEVAGWIVIHGHRAADAGPARGGARVRGWIVGHQHPAVVLSTSVRSAKMVCFAVASRIRMPGLILLPAFSRLPLGSNLLTERHWIVDMKRPRAQEVKIAGIVERDERTRGGETDAQVLDFGPLSGLGGLGAGG
jgi:metallophosphoesterase superfamily enzyme